MEDSWFQGSTPFSIIIILNTIYCIYCEVNMLCGPGDVLCGGTQFVEHQHAILTDINGVDKILATEPRSPK